MCGIVGYVGNQVAVPILVDEWVCLGDVAFKGPQPVECIETIVAVPNLTQIVGNTDQWLFQGFPVTFNPPPERLQQLEAFRQWGLARISPKALARLRGLPFNHQIAIGETQSLFVHSSPHSTEDWLPSSSSEADLAPLVTGHNAQIIVYGHIHNPFVRQVSGRIVINTGSTGNPIDGDNRAAYAILEMSDKADEGATGGAGGTASGGVCGSASEGACGSASEGASRSTCGYMLRRVPYDIDDTVAAAEVAGMPMAEQYARALRTGSAL